MDFEFLIKLIFVINILLGFSVNLGTAAQNLKSSAILYKRKPKTWLQNYPKNLSLVVFLVIVFSIFLPYGKFSVNSIFFDYFRVGFAFVYVLVYWFQVWGFKSLKEFYTQDIIIFTGQRIIQDGPFSILRHPIYFAEIVMDIAAGIALQSYLLLGLTFLFELPILIARANLEEKLLKEELPKDYSKYSKKVSKWIPFI